MKLRNEQGQVIRLRVGDIVRSRLTGTNLVYVFDVTRVTIIPYMTPRSRVFGGHRHNTRDPDIFRIGGPPYTFEDLLRVLAIKDVYTQGEWWKAKISVDIDMGGKDWVIKFDGGTITLQRNEVPLPI